MIIHADPVYNCVVATFRVYLRHADGQLGETVVEAASFQDALAAARAAFPTVTFTRAWMVDDSALVTVNCPKCHNSYSHHVVWGVRKESIVTCGECGASLRLRRERIVVPRPAKKDPPVQVHGHPPKMSIEHTREPSQTDRARSLLEKPDLVRWNCPLCKWAINCDWQERKDIHDCPVCGCKQYVPGSAFAWNSRMIRDREAKQAAAEYARKQAEQAARRAREAEAKRRQRAAEAAQRERERQNQLVLDQLANIAIGAGLIESKEVFQYLDAEEISGIKALSDCADALHADLMNALDDNVLAEKGVAYGRPAAAGASVVSLLAGYGWAGLAFGALAVGARWISNDWKRAQMAQYQAKWTGIFSQFTAEDMCAFTAIFAYKYPALASMAASMQGRLPS